MRLAALGVIYDRVGNMLGVAKSTLYKWLKQEQLLREYKRSRGSVGFSEAKALLGADDMELWSKRGSMSVG